MKEIQELQEPSWKIVTKLGTSGALERGGGGGEAISKAAGLHHQLSTIVPPESLPPRAKYKLKGIVTKKGGFGGWKQWGAQRKRVQ